MARQIKLESLEWIEIVDADNNVTGSFLWNPADLDIVKRCEKVLESFEHMEIPKEEDEQMIFALSDEIKRQFDYLLNSNASETLFEKCNPFSPRPDGALYAEYVLDVLVKFIETELDVRMKKTTSRIKKYTAKYGR